MEKQQHFHAPVTQAAAGDIHNIYATETLWICSDEELEDEAALCERGLNQLHGELWRSLPGAWLGIGAAGMLVVLPWLGWLQSYGNAWLLSMVVAPSVWWQQRYNLLGPDRVFYTERLALIRSIQRIRRRAVTVPLSK